MMKHEFEALAGYQVSEDDYTNIIEPMYMATDMDKDEFVKCINKKRFALRKPSTIIREMKTIARHLEAVCTNYTDWEARERLQDLAEEFIKVKGWMGVNYMIDEEEKWSCYYPKSISIYDKGTYKDVEVINLFK